MRSSALITCERQHQPSPKSKSEINQLTTRVDPAAFLLHVSFLAILLAFYGISPLVLLLLEEDSKSSLLNYTDVGTSFYQQVLHISVLMDIFPGFFLLFLFSANFCSNSFHVKWTDFSKMLYVIDVIKSVENDYIDARIIDYSTGVGFEPSTHSVHVDSSNGRLIFKRSYNFVEDVVHG